LAPAESTASILKRSGKREFPAGTCPVHLGRDAAAVGTDPVLRLTGGPGPGTFTATGGRALVALTACDRLGRANFESGANNLKIDNFRVVRWDKFREYQKAYVDPLVADPANPYATDPSTCYADNFNDIFGSEGTIKVRSTFDDQALRAAARRSYKRFVPFEDNFDRGGRAWMLLNAEILEQAPGNKALVLARSTRVDESGAVVDGDQCATAVVQVGGLKKGDAYVVDFVWQVDNFNDPGIVLSVTIDTQPVKSVVGVGTSAVYRGPSSTKGAQ
jgi:hypothetical protein